MVYGLGEVRDMGHLGQALILKPYLVGKDPLDIEGIMDSLRPHAGHGRFGGGSAPSTWPCSTLPARCWASRVQDPRGEAAGQDSGVRRHECDRGRPALRQAGEDRVETWKLKHLKMDLVPRLIKDRDGAFANGVVTENGIEYWPSTSRPSGRPLGMTCRWAPTTSAA